MQRILNSENLQFKKQESKRKMKFYADKNIEKTSWGLATVLESYSKFYQV